MSSYTSGRILQAYPFRPLRRPLFHPSSAFSLFVTESLPVLISLISLTWGLYTYSYLPLFFLLRAYFLFLLFICAVHSVGLALRPKISETVGLHYHNLGLLFWISLGSNVRYPWSLLLDILVLQFQMSLSSSLTYPFPLHSFVLELYLQISLEFHFEIFLVSTIRYPWTPKLDIRWLYF